MIKEQVAEICIKNCCMPWCDYYCYDYRQSKKICARAYKEAEGIINLFKSAVDKLTVIDDEDKFHCSLPSKYSFGEVKDVIDETAIWQLEDIKKQLLDLRGE